MRARLAVFLLCPSMALAQAPLSAIDWLNDPAREPLIRPDEPPVTDTASTPMIDTSLLGEVQADAVGLLPPQMTGLPPDLWRYSQSADLADLISAQNLSSLPAMQALFYTLLLAEAEAPEGSGRENLFLQARLDGLMQLGAVEPVQALLDRTGTGNAALFARWFDATLLTGDEDLACAKLVAQPHLAPSYAAQVFCTARSGDWSTAALTMDTARVLGFLSSQEEVLLHRFLDPELFEGEPLPHPPVRPSPLVFRLREAIGEPMPTTPLPRAFSVSDLRGTMGWKAQIAAAERLAQTGALAENRLLGIYTERLPAASGGIWDRVDAVQRFDIALRARDAQAVAVTLPKAFTAMKVARLEVPFAKLFAAKLLELPLRGETAEAAYRVALLSPQYETAAQKFGADFKSMAFLSALAQGYPQQAGAKTELEHAVLRGFETTAMPDLFRADMEAGRLGEVILRAMLLYERATRGEVNELATALATFRAVGLEDAARQAALQILLLERRL
ncbi:hypothetical protein TG4357_00251 [Thalassovita gelatinovora]|uniref:Uncharacterized protein n=1 Tax=Thalassovita gelatinovora TaxID=53501 RepID=A0A0P1F4I7_THAGE|nr:hypothetical protein [Thalassovita gelatinovora]QIZ79381.1 hypothetical protein HFZ77_02290 [Thalassovita gelatinovora]CUH62691.1 hypothetical protein TG4357_00251 [Thalassovita gelatinovora]SEQ08607.1 hypothetical protein SAMN04488043_103151 [Thalassovita gelatinovora]